MSRVYISRGMRNLVYKRSRGKCEFCLMPESFSFSAHHMDHSIAVKHGGKTTLDNLALTCSSCNLRKGTDLASIDPETHEIVRLYNPRRDIWSDHFMLVGPEINALTPVGRTTVRLLNLNSSLRLMKRRVVIAVGVSLHDETES